MGVLEELQTGIGRIAEQVGPAVVGLGRFGSGVVVADGQVLTNAHNVRREARTVVFGDVVILYTSNELTVKKPLVFTQA